MKRAEARQTCGKHAYTSRKDAQRAKVRSELREDIPLRVYFDPTCGCWHLSSRPQQDNDQHWRKTQ